MFANEQNTNTLHIKTFYDLSTQSIYVFCRNLRMVILSLYTIS
jgi:hypothetical protein